MFNEHLHNQPSHYGLRHYCKIGKLQVQTASEARSSFGPQLYGASNSKIVKKGALVKLRSVTSGE